MADQTTSDQNTSQNTGDLNANNQTNITTNSQKLVENVDMSASDNQENPIPLWLQKVQQESQLKPEQVNKNATYNTGTSSNTVVGNNSNSIISNAKQNDSVLNTLNSLKAHEENIKFDDDGVTRLDNVISSPEKEKFLEEEKSLEGLNFEGLDEKKGSQKALEDEVNDTTVIDNADIKHNDKLRQASSSDTVSVTSSDLGGQQLQGGIKDLMSKDTVNQQIENDGEASEWLKNLSDKTSQEVPKEAESVVQNNDQILSNDKEKKKVTQLEMEVLADEKKKELKKEAQNNLEKKKNLFQTLSDKFWGVTKVAQQEIEKGKTAGVEESHITLENFEEIKAAKRFAEKTETTKTKEKIAFEERQQLLESEKIFQEGMATVRDLIAPSSMEVAYDHLRVEGMFSRTFITYAYPRYLDTNWMSPIVNLDATLDIAQFIYPIDSAKIMKILSKKVTQMSAAMKMNAEKGLIRDPALETAYTDAEQLRTEIQRGQEKFFQFAMYITVYADELEKIDRVSKQLESLLGSKLILTKRADLRMEHGFNSTSPLGLDELEIFRNMNTGPLSTSFPFSSSDLTTNEGVLYGLNRHNDSLVIFDRFSLPNANSVCFAISGAGKSYAVKLEILRYLMLGVDVIVIDPENEYEELARTVGGSYLRVSLTSDRRINPFDLPAPLKDEELQPGDLLRSNIITLHGLLKLMLGGLSPAEEGIVDKALNDVYALKGITMDMIDPSNLPVPTMEDLHALLINMEGATNIAQRLEKFTSGTYSGIFNKPTNVDMKSGLMVFSIRDLEDALRPIAMYIILNYIWNRIRSSLKKRLMIVDEAWTMMQHEDSAKFLFGLVKRARKYYLGITTITQDVEDFMKSTYGKPIVTNSSMQLLLKQSPAAIDTLQKLFNLTEGEKYMLLNSGVGQGLFFAGQKHVAMQIIASYTEDKIVTTNPEDILRSLGKGDETIYES